MPACSAFRHFQAKGVAFLRAETSACARVFQIERDLAWYGKSLDFDPDGTGRSHGVGSGSVRTIAGSARSMGITVEGVK